MRAVFARRRRSTGGTGTMGLWLRTIAEVLFNAAAVHWDILQQDMSYMARMLRRSPGFAITAVLIVSLGIGATTAAFSITDFVLLRPLPFPEPDRLVQIWEATARVQPNGILCPELSRLEGSGEVLRNHGRVPTATT